MADGAFLAACAAAASQLSVAQYGELTGDGKQRDEALRAAFAEILGAAKLIVRARGGTHASVLDGAPPPRGAPRGTDRFPVRRVDALDRNGGGA